MTKTSSARAAKGRPGSVRKTPKTATTKKTSEKEVEKSVVTIGNYASAMEFLNNRVDVERTRVRRLDMAVFKLDRMYALMKALGDPQDSLRFVHVAGTKGKGSTCALVAAALENCGYTIGLFTSPHLVDLRERIQINGTIISHPAFVEIMKQVAKAEAEISEEFGKPTFFEIMTAVALCFFAQKAVDITIMECGLGGRLDATNIIKPDVTAVTAIALDHTQILGDTLPKIAREKAGIFKAGVHALTIGQPDEVLEAMREVAVANGTTLNVLGKDIDFSYRFEASPKLGPHTCICMSSERSNYEHVNVPLQGEHQALNCGLALAIVDRLRERGFETPELKVIDGVESARGKLPGRMDLIWKSPRILIDGAHNPTSITALIRSIGAHVPYDSMVMVFGCAEDKDVDGLLTEISLGADKVIFTRAKSNSRSMDPDELRTMFSEKSVKMAQVAPDIDKALEMAARAVGRDDLICVTGSFYLVGEAKKHLELLAARRASAAAKA